MLPINVWRHGNDEEFFPRHDLKAGPLSVTLEQGELHSICMGEREVIKRIYVAVRDRNWDTVPPVVSNLQVTAGAETFHATFDVDCVFREISFHWTGTISGNVMGTIVFSLRGVAQATFLRNRLGFCILHPASYAGAPCVLFHSDGSEERSVFPEEISPHQPFFDLHGISHEVIPGIWAETLFDGEIFETEDQRNWTDASYKTYCTPLRIPFPVRIEKDSTVFQTVTVRLKSELNAASLRYPVSVIGGLPRASLKIDSKVSVGRLSAIGLCTGRHGQSLSEREAGIIRAMHLDHLRVDLDLAQSDISFSLSEAVSEAASVRTALHIAIHLSDAAEPELLYLRGLLESSHFEGISLWLVFRKGEPCTSDPWLELARRILGPLTPSAKFASGTNAFFAELNRGTPPGRYADCIVYSVNPQVHTFDDASIMETLSAQATTVECARRISEGRPVMVGPVTLKARFNAVATGPISPVPPGELPPQVDTRQMSLFAAAWTLGSLASLSVAGAAVTTWYEVIGWKGVMETAGGPPAPRKFPALAGCVFPLYHVLADAAEMGTGEIVRSTSGDPTKLAGIAIRSDERRRVMVANLALDTQTVALHGIDGQKAYVRLLDETTVEKACHDPGQFRANRGSEMLISGGKLYLKLLPYAVARIDVEK